MTDESEPKNLPNQDNLESEISSDEDDVVEFVFNDDGEEDIKATLKKLRKDFPTNPEEPESKIRNGDDG